MFTVCQDVCLLSSSLWTLRTGDSQNQTGPHHLWCVDDETEAQGSRVSLDAGACASTVSAVTQTCPTQLRFKDGTGHSRSRGGKKGFLEAVGLKRFRRKSETQGGRKRGFLTYPLWIPTLQDETESIFSVFEPQTVVPSLSSPEYTI